MIKKIWEIIKNIFLAVQLVSVLTENSQVSQHLYNSWLLQAEDEGNKQTCSSYLVVQPCMWVLVNHGSAGEKKFSGNQFQSLMQSLSVCLFSFSLVVSSFMLQSECNTSVFVQKTKPLFGEIVILQLTSHFVCILFFKNSQGLWTFWKYKIPHSRSGYWRAQMKQFYYKYAKTFVNLPLM